MKQPLTIADCETCNKIYNNNINSGVKTIDELLDLNDKVGRDMNILLNAGVLPPSAYDSVKDLVTSLFNKTFHLNSLNAILNSDDGEG